MCLPAFRTAFAAIAFVGLLGVQADARSAPVPLGGPLSHGTVVEAAAPIPPDSALGLLNQLQAVAWTDFSAQTVNDAQTQVNALNGKVLAHKGRTCYGIGACVAYTVKLTDMALTADLASPPGMRSACLAPSDCLGATPGFRVEAPLDNSWKIHLNEKLNVDASVWGVIPYLKCCKAKDVSLDLTNIKFTQATTLNAAEPDRPTLTSAQISAHMTLAMHGGIYTNQPVDLNFSASVNSSGQIEFTDPSPIDLNVTLIDLEGVEIPGKIRNFKLEMLYDPAQQNIRAKLSGKFDINLAKVSGQVFAITEPFEAVLGLPIPNGILSTIQTGMPRQWGENPPQSAWTQPAAGVDFAGPASQMESAIAAHLPWGAILSIDHAGTNAAGGSFGCWPVPAGNPPHLKASPTCWNREFDSAIWTGHYLAAESFRYAATQSPDALARVKQVLEGVQRLFWVTQDAAVSKNGRIVPVTEGAGIFSRTAIPADREVGSGAPPSTPVPLTDDTGSIPGIGICYYERPEGGWNLEAPLSGGAVPKKHFLTYQQASEALARLPLLNARSAKIVPVGRIWYGLGCGEPAEHPISRDQYVGIMMGLAYANALVPDADVQKTTQALITEALDYLIRNGWDVRLPPDGRIPAGSTFLGIWDYQLGFLRIGASVNPTGLPGPYNFHDLYAKYAAASKFSWIPGWVSTADPMPQYYKFNLSHAVIGPTLFYETDPALRQNYMLWYKMLRRSTGHHKNAYFNLDRALVELPADRAAVLNEHGLSNPHLTLADETKGILAEWLHRRDLVKASDGLPLNNVADPGYQANLFTHGGIAPYTTIMGDHIYAAKYAMPVYARDGNGLDFAWERGPFNVALDPHSDRAGCSASLGPLARHGSATALQNQILKCGSDLSNQEAPGVDYLLAYWMAVYLDVLPKP